MNRYEYRVIETFCKEYEIATYGISVWLWQSGESVEVCSVKDISPDKRAVLELAECCQRGQVSPVHLMDVIKDFLQQLTRFLLIIDIMTRKVLVDWK